MSESVYTAVATSTGEGRAGGQVVSSDHVLDLTLAVPTEMGGPGGGTNPEQLFAAGWSACFHSALKGVAKKQGVDISDTAVVAEIGLASTETGYDLVAALHVEMSGVEQSVADELVQAAHEVCPYSRATRGNIRATVDATVA